MKKKMNAKKVFASFVLSTVTLGMTIPSMTYAKMISVDYSSATLSSVDASNEITVFKPVSFDSTGTTGVLNENVPTPKVDPVKHTDKFVKVKQEGGVDRIRIIFPKNIEVNAVQNVKWEILVDDNKTIKLDEKDGKILIPIPEKVKLVPGEKITITNYKENTESKQAEIVIEKEPLEKPIIQDITEGDSVIKIKTPKRGDEIVIQLPDNSNINILKGQNGWKDKQDKPLDVENEYLIVSVDGKKIVEGGTVTVNIKETSTQASEIEKKTILKKPVIPEIVEPNSPTIEQPYSGDKSININLPKPDMNDPKRNPKQGDKILVSIMNLGNKENEVEYEITGNDIDKGSVKIQVPELKKGYDIKAEIINKEGKKSKAIEIKVLERKTGSGGSSSSSVIKPKLPKKMYKVSRISGVDRIGTAIEVSKKYYNKADSVIIARADIYPDSLTAGVLAKALNAPILITKPGNLDKRVEAEITRLEAKNVIIVGGRESITPNVEKLLNKFDKNIERLAGSDRYATSSLVGDKVAKLLGKKKTAIIASGEKFADALSIGAYASENGYPILLVKKDSVPSRINKSFKDMGIEKVYVIGGNDTIDEKVIKQLPEVKERIFGADRYETSAMVAKLKFGNSSHAFIASGEVFSDSLVIGAIGGNNHMPILLTNKKAVSKSVIEFVKKSMLNDFAIIGGENTISNATASEIVIK